jgi:hypothetical protein
MMNTGLPAAGARPVWAMSRISKNHRLGPRLNPACIFTPDRRMVSRNARNGHADLDVPGSLCSSGIGRGARRPSRLKTTR